MSCSPKIAHEKTAATSQRQKARGFTLLELLVVIGIISILLVALVPSITSLAKSSGRKAAIGNLLGAIEQARAQAIKDGQSTYVVFPADLGATTDQAAIQRYSYRCYSVFEDDPPPAATRKQLTPWRTLPTGVSLRSKANSGSLTDLATGITFPFQPLGSSATFPYIKFNANGEVEEPSNNVLLVIFEGNVATGNEVITGARDKLGNPLATEALNISRLTGRAQPTATPTPTS